MAIDIAFEANVDLGEGAKSLKSLKQEFKETQKELDGLTAGSEKYVQTLKKLGKIKDDIGDLNQEIKAFNPEGKVQAFGTVLSGVSSGFQAATGAAALFGGENKNLEKTLVKLQAVMAFTEGIKGLVSLGDGFKVLGNIVKANPIFLVIGVLTAIGAGLYALRNKIGVIGDAFEFLGEVITTVVQAGKDFLDFIGATSFASDEKADKIIKNAQREAVALEDRYDREIARAKAAGKETSQLEKQKQLDIIKTLRVEAEAIVAAAKARGKFTDEENARFTELIKATQKASDEIVLINITEEKKKEDLKAKTSEKNKAELDKQKSEHQKYLDAVADAENKAADEYDAAKKKQKEELRALEIKSFQEAQVDAQAMADANERNSIAGFELQSLKNKTDLDLQLQFLEAKKQKELENKDLTENEKLLIEEKYRQQGEQLELQANERRLNVAANLNSSLQSLADIYFTAKISHLKKGSAEELAAAKKQFQINKALQLTGAIIDGAKAIMTSLAYSPLAIGVVPNPIGIASLASVGLASIANIAKIAAAKFNETGGGSTGGSSGVPTISAPSTGNAPSINAPSNSGTTLNPDGTVRNNNNNQQPIHAYVVETDITSTQYQIHTIQQNAIH
jgi:hypothetical protein